MSHLPKMLTTSAYFVYQNCIANNNNNKIDLLSKSRFNVGATKRCIVQNCTVCTASAEPGRKHFLLECGWALPQYVLLKNYDQTLNLWKPWSPQCKSRINAGATKRCHSTEAAAQWCAQLRRSRRESISRYSVLPGKNNAAILYWENKKRTMAITPWLLL